MEAKESMRRSKLEAQKRELNHKLLLPLKARFNLVASSLAELEDTAKTLPVAMAELENGGTLSMAISELENGGRLPVSAAISLSEYA